MAKISTALVLRNEINFTLSCGINKNNHCGLCSKYFRILIYHVTLQTTVIVVLRGAKEHHRMNVKLIKQRIK